MSKKYYGCFGALHCRCLLMVSPRKPTASIRFSPNGFVSISYIKGWNDMGREEVASNNAFIDSYINQQFPGRIHQEQRSTSIGSGVAPRRSLIHTPRREIFLATKWLALTMFLVSFMYYYAIQETEAFFYARYKQLLFLHTMAAYGVSEITATVLLLLTIIFMRNRFEWIIKSSIALAFLSQMAVCCLWIGTCKLFREIICGFIDWSAPGRLVD